MPSEKPTILLIHGAYQSPQCWDLIIPQLEALYYHVISPENPTSHSDDPTRTHLDDVAAIHAAIVPVMDQGKEIIVVAHSYGGIPGTVAVEGHTVEERQARGQKGGIKAMLFVSAFALVKKGDSFQDFWGKVVDWVRVDDKLFCHYEPHALPLLYTNLPSRAAEARFATRKHQTLASFLTPVHVIPADLRIPMTYIFCGKDEVVDPACQERMIAAVAHGNAGNGMKVVRMDDEGHFVILTQPGEVVRVIEDVAGS